MHPKPKQPEATLHSQLSTYTLPEWAAVIGLALVIVGLVVGSCLT